MGALPNMSQSFPLSKYGKLAKYLLNSGFRSYICVRARYILVIRRLDAGRLTAYRGAVHSRGNCDGGRGDAGSALCPTYR